jgi:hypothetical protein
MVSNKCTGLTDSRGQMSDRLLYFDCPPTELVIRFPFHWRAIIFFGTLALLHSINAGIAVWNRRIEGELSLIFASLFIFLTFVSIFLRTELAICRSANEIRLRRRLGRIWNQRSIPFENVYAVRLFLSENGHRQNSQIEILCNEENIECPQSCIPRQQALCLAVAMNVELIKVCYDDTEYSENRFNNLEKKNLPRKSKQ